MRQLRSFALLRRKPPADPAAHFPNDEPKGDAQQPSPISGGIDELDAADIAGLKAVQEAIESASAVVSAAAQELASIDKEDTAQADTLQHAVEQGLSVVAPEKELIAQAPDKELTVGAPAVAAASTERIPTSAEDPPAPLGLTAAVDAASEKVREAVSCARSANWTVADLADATQDIAAMMDVVSSVARQTTLLALNVTIETARAGEAGMGFADVANGVKSLSIETSRAARDICARIERLRDSVDSSLGSMEKAVSMIEGLQPILGEVRSAVAEKAVDTPRLPKATGFASLTGA